MRAVTHKCVAAVAAALVFAAPATAAEATPDSGDGRLEKVRETVNELYHKAESATDRYNAAQQRVTTQQHKVRHWKRAVAKKRVRVRAARRDVGQLARMQYRSDMPLPPSVRLLLSKKPEEELNRNPRMHSTSQTVSTSLNELRRARAQLSRRKDAADKALGRLTKAKHQRATQKKTVEGRLKKAKHTLDGLRAREAKKVKKLQAAADKRAEQRFTSQVSSDALHGTHASGRAKKAIAYARSQLGKPYVWGAQGPDSFDCSGLTSQAWQHAGVSVPRTSQQQWAQLQRVSAQSMRPGDLVIYFPDATHVGIYVGGGKVVHAPRPGTSVTVAPVGRNPVKGVVRP